MKRPRFSLRLKLLLWLVGIFLIVHLTLALVLALYQRQSLAFQLDNNLFARGTELREKLASFGGESWSDELLRRLDADERDAIFVGDLLIAVYDTAGELRAATRRAGLPEFGRVAWETPRDRRFRGAKFAAFDVRLNDDPDADPQRVRAVSIPIDAEDPDEDGVVLLATPDQFANELADLTARLILIGIPVGLVSVTIAGWFVAGAAVRPLERLRDQATTISPDTISREVDLHSSDTEVERLQDALNDAMSRLEAGYESQERFLSNVSHEIKTPVSVLMTEAQLVLRDKDASQAARELARSTESEMRNLAQLVESFLLLTRVREAGDGVPRRPVDLNDVAVDAIVHTGKFAESFSVPLKADLFDAETHDDPDREPVVLGDSDLLRIMLDNLLRNAVRFSPTGSAVDLKVACEADAAILTVRDRGPGIPPDVAERLFDRFAQADTEHRAGRGSGLGLEIAQGIAELHGGSIAAGNHPEGGALFTVRLALASAKPDAERLA